jgi:putative flippase GtrA
VPIADRWSVELRRSRRFIVVGATNTLATAALFVLLAQVLAPRLAYTIVFALGLAVTTVATGRWVFENDRLSLRRAAVFAGWYLLVYGIGLLVLTPLERARIAEPIMAVTVIAVTAPLNYLGGRAVFTRPAPPTSRAGHQERNS